ncbi:hypothetical protein [Neptunomonas qingdaonensis]|uniref:GDSL-like Lipase/Acylhydrolase family protein n=1 Tax=Neptunomonas qingdaonensis TaxID=1045558 RepID=A0A1I2QZG3_9GAMM|nr:hypothetical protein [Neptunomonas qingdaonensis]SFG31091.1 hypothetical protein SAMN05216175_105106 [Neptunomonas qingdaonensis]
MARRKFRPNVITWHEAQSEIVIPSNDPVFNDNLILAEGDSWFTLAGIPTSNLLFSMRFTASTLIVNCAKPGDTIINMSKMLKNSSFKSALSEEGLPWHLLLISGGGNDLIDEAENIILSKDERADSDINNMESYCDLEIFEKVIENIKDSFRKIVNLRDSPNSPAIGKPILVHTYDYFVPRNAPARFFPFTISGPWLYPVFSKAEIPEGIWIELAQFLVDKLAEGILELAEGSNKLHNFHVVDTRGTLVKAKLGSVGDSHDWLNEIHPDSAGYSKISKKIDAKILELKILK